jgi:transcriptional regulator with XRE-family HTH domain
MILTKAEMLRGEFPSMLFARELRKLMNAQEPKLSIRDLAMTLGSSYEFIRKLVNGEAFPSKYFITSMAKTFEVSEERLKELVTRDQVARKYGDLTIKTPLPYSDPELAVIEKSWPSLTDPQKKTVLSLIKSALVENRRRADTDGRR